MRRRGESGTALVEFVWLGLILLVPIVYLLLAVFDVQRAAYGVDAASRAAGRAYVLSPDQATALVRARAAAEVAMADQGLAFEAADLAVSCTPDPDRCLAPGSTVTVTITAHQPLPVLPEVLGGSRPAVRVDASHSEPYGLFREDRS